MVCDEFVCCFVGCSLDFDCLLAEDCCYTLGLSIEPFGLLACLSLHAKTNAKYVVL